MDGVSEEQVRLRAYEIWIDLGCADGQAHDHWVAAERDLMAQPVKAKAARAPAAKAKTAAPKSAMAVAPKTVLAKASKAKKAPAAEASGVSA